MPGMTYALLADLKHFQPLACVNQTVGAVSAPLANVPATARGAIVSGDGSANAIRYRLDAGAATATLGVRLDGIESVMLVSRAALEGMTLVREDAADVIISVQFFK